MKEMKMINKDYMRIIRKKRMRANRHKLHKNSPFYIVLINKFASLAVTENLRYFECIGIKCFKLT